MSTNENVMCVFSFINCSNIKADSLNSAWLDWCAPLTLRWTKLGHVCTSSAHKQSTAAPGRESLRRRAREPESSSQRLRPRSELAVSGGPIRRRGTPAGAAPLPRESAAYRPGHLAPSLRRRLCAHTNGANLAGRLRREISRPNHNHINIVS